jgi:predicted nucleotidyltransferase
VFRELIEKVARNLESHKVPYMLIGGQAVLFYGEPRLTKDIDITLGLDTSSVQTVLSIVSELGLEVLVGDPVDFVVRTMVLPTFDPVTNLRIDFVFSNSSYEKEALKRAKIAKFGETSVKIASLEDLIIHKVIAQRPRDIEDIKGVMLKNKEFDRRYILRWFKRFDRELQTNYAQTFSDIEKQIRAQRKR